MRKLIDKSLRMLERTDRKLGKLWSRLGGTIFLVLGFAVLLSALAMEDFTIATYWPVVGGACLFWLLAWLCFRSRDGLIDTLVDSPSPRRRK